MRKFLVLSCFCLLVLWTRGAAAQELPAQATAASSDPPIDFSAFLALGKEVEEYRQTRLVSLEEFKRLAMQENTLILDSRSRDAYESKHLRGAIHLNFSDFTEEKLAQIIPNKNTAILIYCNNNFQDDPVAFPTKKIELALNVPTFINLYGYGYKNVYELKDYLSVHDPALEFEQTRLKTGERIEEIKD